MSRYVLNVISQQIFKQLQPRWVAAVTNLLTQYQIKIEFTRRLSAENSHDISAFELSLSTPNLIDETKLKPELAKLATHLGLDLAIQEEAFYRSSKSMIAFDMDSTLILNEGIDELARENGSFAEVSKITEAAMQGKIDFNESLTQRVALLKGIDEAALEQIFTRIQLTPGATELVRVLKTKGFKVGVISGGFDFIAKKIAADLHFDFCFTNHLEMSDGKLTGKVSLPIINAQKKAEHLVETAKRFQIPLGQVIAVGDGANDLEMIQKAGLGIAFCAKPAVREKADISIQSKNLKSVLFLLGISEDDLV